MSYEFQRRATLVEFSEARFEFSLDEVCQRTVTSAAYAAVKNACLYDSDDSLTALQSGLQETLRRLVLWRSL